MKNLTFCLFLLAASVAGCQKDDTVVNLTGVSCAPDAPELSQVRQEEAVVAFVAAEQQYALVRGNSRGIIYQKNYGVACNLPASFREEGKRVRFSGTYKQYSGPAVLKAIGETYNYLDVKKLQAL